MKRPALLIAFLIGVSFLSVETAHAQSFSSGTANGITINDKVANGDIVTSTTNGYKRSNSPYDPQLFGVVSVNPAIYVKNTTAKGNTPVISLGDTMVRVSSINGNIKFGDFITSSTILGIGQKATENGFVLGRAEQSYSSNDPKKVGLILVTLQPHYQQLTNDIVHNATNAFTLGLSAAFTSPLGVIRYFVSGLITLLSFFFGFRFFARTSNRGVEAIGRNPLAKQAILLSVLFNTIITIAIMFFGVAISYLILVL